MLPLPAGPRVCWAFDLLFLDQHIVAVAVCGCSKYTVLRHLPDKQAFWLADLLREIIGMFGVMQEVRVDNGTELAGDFAHVCTEYGVKLTVMPPYHRRGNGQVER